jgi:protein-S-isoprenylcysteine O-methyltransferase Ste14
MRTGSQIKSRILVWMQIVCILVLLVKIPFLHCNIWALLVSLLGPLLGIWAVVTMRLDNISISPDVKQNARLVTNGPYKVIRHPMYSAIIIAFSPFVIDQHSILLISVLIVLLITLLIKLNYEERLLQNHFEEYSSYSKHSWRLIPFIY